MALLAAGCGAPGDGSGHSSLAESEPPGGDARSLATGAVDPQAAYRAVEAIEPEEVFAPFLEAVFGPDNILAQRQTTEPQVQDLDLDGSGSVDIHDLEAWAIGLEVARMQGDAVAEFHYDATRDVNADGFVDTLDLCTLRLAIARHLAGRGATFVYNGEVIDPSREILGFDGAHVQEGHLDDMKDLWEAAQGDVHGKEEVRARRPHDLSSDGEESGGDECEGGVATSPFDPIPFASRTWLEGHLVLCFGNEVQTEDYVISVTVAGGTYNPNSFQLACGAGPITYHLSASYTTESHVSADLGAAIDGVFNVGVTWGASQTTTITQSIDVTFESPDGKESKYWLRFLKYNVTVSRTPDGGLPPGCYDDWSASDSDTIYTLSTQTKSQWRGCGCPGVFDQ